MHRELLARAPPSASASPVDFERHQHADLAEARRQRVVHVGGDHALRRPRAGAVRRSTMFSPIVAIRLVSSSVDRPAGARIRGRLQRLDVAVAVERELGDRADKLLEQLVAGDEVGLGVDLDQGTGGAAQRPRRPGLRRRPGRPSWRRRPGPSCAASRSPPRCRRSFSPSALLQSIMPAPVFSRSSLTSAAVISAIVSFLFVSVRRRSSDARGLGLGPARRAARPGWLASSAHGFGGPARPRAPRPQRPRSARPAGSARAPISTPEAVELGLQGRRAPRSTPGRNRAGSRGMASSLPGIG